MTSSKNIRPHYHHGDSQRLDNPRLTSTPQVRAVALPVGKSIKNFTCPWKIPLLTIFFTHRRHPVCDKILFNKCQVSFELTFFLFFSEHCDSKFMKPLNAIYAITTLGGLNLPTTKRIDYFMIYPRKKETCTCIPLPYYIVRRYREAEI